MKKDRSGEALDGAFPCDFSGASRPPSVEECRRLPRELRSFLEDLDDEVRSAHARIEADLLRGDLDHVEALRASAMVLVSVAAGINQGPRGQDADLVEVAGFVDAARDAIRDAAERLSIKDGARN